MTDSSIAQIDEKPNCVRPGDFAIVVATSQHAFAGTVLWTDGNDVMLENARLLYWWLSHTMLTDLAQHGFDTRAFYSLPRPVNQMMVSGAVAILRATEKCRESLTAAPVTRYDASPVIERLPLRDESNSRLLSDTFGT